MLKRVALAAAVTALAAGTALADFSYEQTSKITGGAMQSMMKVAGVFSKQAREPMRSTIAVKGNRMATIMNGMSAHVIDLDKETITEVNFEKKTYSVITFAQWMEAMKQMDAKMREKQKESGEMTVKASVKDTGAKRQVAGFDSHQVIAFIEMQGTNAKTGETGTFMTVTADMWMAPVAGYEEVRNFYRRMAEKLSWSPSFGLMSAQPGTQKGMAEMMKEVAKIDGVPVYQVTKMGMGPAMPQGQAGSQQQQQPQQQQQQAEEKPSAGSALGKIGGRLGGFGGFGRKKKQDEAQTQPAAGQTSQQASGGAPPDAAGSLMEMTSELSGFSTAAVDSSKFEVPAGFKQIESDTLKVMKR